MASSTTTTAVALRRAYVACGVVTAVGVGAINAANWPHAQQHFDWQRAMAASARRPHRAGDARDDDESVADRMRRAWQQHHGAAAWMACVPLKAAAYGAAWPLVLTSVALDVRVGAHARHFCPAYSWGDAAAAAIAGRYHDALLRRSADDDASTLSPRLYLPWRTSAVKLLRERKEEREK